MKNKLHFQKRKIILGESVHGNKKISRTILYTMIKFLQLYHFVIAACNVGSHPDAIYVVYTIYNSTNNVVYVKYINHKPFPIYKNTFALSPRT